MRLIISLIIFLAVLPLRAQDLRIEADSAYLAEHYQDAAAMYERVLKKGSSADVYYNLGNCYFRMEKLGLAILNYERAYRLSPGDSDIRHNLEFASLRTKDKITPAGEVFIVTWYKSLLNYTSVDSWAIWATIFFVLFLAGTGMYLFLSEIRFRKIGFYSALVSLVLAILFNILAFMQKQNLLTHDTAIVMDDAATVKSTPSKSGTDLFVIHEGTKVNITDSSMKEWKEVRLDDGKKGWIRSTSIELI